MSQHTLIERMVNAYVAFRQAPRYSREADKRARKFQQARREALKRCGPDAVVAALNAVQFI